MVFFAPLMTFLGLFVWPILHEYSQEDHEHQKTCHENQEIGGVLEVVFFRSNYYKRIAQMDFV